MRAIKLSVLMTISFAVTTSCGMLDAKKLYPSEDELRKEYKQSKDQFKAKYNGKEVSVFGRTDGSIPDDGLAIVRFQSSTDDSVSGTPSITCYVTSDDVPRFKQLNVENGTLIRVKGKMEVGEHTLSLNDCELVKAGATALSDD